MSKWFAVAVCAALSFTTPGLVPADGPKPGVSVFVPPGKDAPPGLERFALKSAVFGGRQLVIGPDDPAAVDEALKNPDLHAEFDRPKAFTPLDTITPFNLDARVSHLVSEFEAAYPAVRGRGVAVAVFDEGRVRATHREFRATGSSRVTPRTTSGLSRHATHCAGTVGAAGVEPQATGMATGVKLFSYDWNFDTTNMANHGDDFQVSSHSYGPVSGWWLPPGGTWVWCGGATDREDAKYGKYANDCRQFDVALARHTHLLTFVAAGNDRGKAPPVQPTVHRIFSTGALSSMVRPRTGGATGLDSISGAGLAKNVICIGAVNDIPQGGGLNTIRITTFTGVGPADDGRIKPDLVANGLQLFSTSSAADDAYVTLSGTSMATPTAAGIGALMWEHYKATFDRAPMAAEIKAVLIHTACDAGTPGPDPQYGWGSIDALAAGNFIKGKGGSLVADPSANAVAEGQTQTFTFTATGDPIRATVVWTDTPGTPNTRGIDNATAALVNDLDTRVIAPDGTVYLPYSLDLANLWNPTTNAPAPARRDRPNRVDNVEVVDAKSVPGEWKVEVKGFKVPGGAKQAFALAVSGLKPPAKP